MAAIPKIIHQFWDRETPPDDVMAEIQGWRDHNPGWQHILWNDETAEGFIAEAFGANEARCFKACLVPAMRADVFRLGVLLSQGGVYVDADAVSKAPIDAIASQPALPVGHGKQSGAIKIKNSFMVDEPDGPFFCAAWRTAIYNIRQRKFPDNISRSTGPMMLTRIWGKRLTDEERAHYRLLMSREVRPFYHHGGSQLGYRSEGGHWGEQMAKGPIIDPAKLPPADGPKRPEAAG